MSSTWTDGSEPSTTNRRCEWAARRPGGSFSELAD